MKPEEQAAQAEVWTAGTAYAALVLRAAPLTLVMMAVQFCALGWYCASFIPFGRLCIQRCVGRVCCPV